MAQQFSLTVCILFCLAEYSAWAVPQGTTNDLPWTKINSNSGFLGSKSPLHLMKLAKFERLVYTKLKEYTETLQERLRLLKAYTDDFEQYSLDLTRQPLDDPEDWIWATQTSSEPISARRFIRRMTSELPRVLKSIGIGTEADLMHTVGVAQEGLDWPTKGDLAIITQSVLDIPIVFDDITVTYIAEGKLHGGGDVGTKLDAAECNEIAVVAYDLNRYASAVQWFDAGWRRFRDEYPQTIPEEILDANFKEAVEKHDEVLAELSASEGPHRMSHFWDYDLFIENITSLQAFEGNSLRHLHDLVHGGKDELNPMVRFWGICNGRNYQREQERYAGYCFYQRKFHSYLALNPFKVEVFNRFPLVAQIHEFNSQSMSIALISEGMPQLVTLNGIQEGSTDEEQNNRLPVPAILNSHELESLKQFEFKIQFLMSISGRLSDEHVTSTSERLHVGVYSFTNFDKTLDNFPDPVFQGDQMQEQETLNFHLFLNNVDEGGQTVFPRLGFGVKPIQNSALIWSEFKINGIGHPDLFWTNCPIVSGNKWVATKYVRRVGISLRRLNIFK